MGSWIEDTRYAARRLARTPLFTVAAIAILALAIGVNTAAFTVVDGMLFRPPPFEDPDRLVSVYQDSDDGEPSSTSFPAYGDMAAMTGVFAGVAATSITTALLPLAASRTFKLYLPPGAPMSILTRMTPRCASLTSRVTFLVGVFPLQLAP